MDNYLPKQEKAHYMSALSCVSHLISNWRGYCLTSVTCHFYAAFWFWFCCFFFFLECCCFYSVTIIIITTIILICLSWTNSWSISLLAINLQLFILGQIHQSIGTAGGSEKICWLYNLGKETLHQGIRFFYWWSII